jgi:hypothetical protein
MFTDAQNLEHIQLKFAALSENRFVYHAHSVNIMLKSA